MMLTLLRCSKSRKLLHGYRLCAPEVTYDLVISSKYEYMQYQCLYRHSTVQGYSACTSICESSESLIRPVRHAMEMLDRVLYLPG